MTEIAGSSRWPPVRAGGRWSWWLAKGKERVGGRKGRNKMVV